MSEFVLTTRDGVQLSASRQPAIGEPRAAVVLVHGFTASKDHPEVRSVANALARAGYDVITYDARGHHSSAGLCTLGDSEWLDVAAATAEARRSSASVITVGASMGAIAVLRHAANDPDLAGVVTVSSPALWRLPKNLRALFATLLTRTRAGRAFAARKLGVRIHPTWTDAEPPVVLAQRIVAPLAVIHGDSDRIIPASAAAELIHGANGGARLDIVSGMSHAFDPLSIPPILGAVDWVMTSAARVQP